MTTSKHSSPGQRQLRAVGYIRVSTQDQAVNGISLDTQRELLEAEARRRGWSLEIVADEGASGATEARPGLQKCLSQLDCGAFDVLIVTRLDRLTRSVQGLHKTLERSQRANWELVIISPGIDTTEPTGRFATSILACAAQYERDLISLRTKEALAHKKATGASLGRPRNISDELVARIHQERAQKKSLRAIADQLNADQVPTAQGGGKWHASTVSAILKMYSAAGEPDPASDPAILS